MKGAMKAILIRTPLNKYQRCPQDQVRIRNSSPGSVHSITYPFPAVTLEKVLLEVQVVLGQVRKLSGEVKAMEKSQGIAIKKLKRDVELIKDTLIKTDRPKIVWPVKTQEEFDSLNDEIETNSIFADQMVFIIITN